MYPTYPDGVKVTVTVDYPTVGGEEVVPTAIQYAVLDEAGDFLTTRTALTIDPEAGSTISADVAATFNTLANGAIRALRAVRFYFVTAAGEVPVTYRYIVEQASKLTVMVNSFQTFEQAILTRLELPSLDGWDSAAEADQIAALVTAHERMCRLSYRYRLGQDAVEYDANNVYWHITDIGRRTAADFAGWEPAFKTALKRAQVYEADQILKGDPIGDKRRDGIVSETIGEAKMFLNPRPPLRLALCREAMEVLGRYLYTTNNRIGRA